MKQQVYVTKTLIDGVSVSEIDFDLYEEFGVDISGDDELVILEANPDRGDADGYPINIDRMMKMLQDLKDSGSTHVELDYHCDHIGYNVDGYKYEKSTNPETDEYLSKQKHRANIEKQKTELRDKIKALNKL